MGRNNKHLLSHHIKSKQNNRNYDSKNSEDNNISFIINSKSKNKINSYLKLQSR